MIRAVLDTNILVSALISPKGTPARIVKAWQQQRFSLVASKSILKEVEKVLRYPKIRGKYRLTPCLIVEYIKGLTVFSEFVSPKIEVKIIKEDPADNKFLEAAISGGANYIVSGDKHILKLNNFGGIKILTAKDFFQIIKS